MSNSAEKLFFTVERLGVSFEAIGSTPAVPSAARVVAALDKACTFGCDEYKDLKAAVARFKANGNRYLAAP